MVVRFSFVPAFALVCGIAHAEKNLSPEMKSILTARLDKSGACIKVDDLRETKKEDQPTLTNDHYEVYAVPVPPGLADAFSYHVILEKDTGRFWIRRSGGYAGITKVFGPGTIAVKGDPQKKDTPPK